MPEPTKVQHENWTGKIKHTLSSGEVETIYYKLADVEAAQMLGCLEVRTRGREGGFFLHWWKSLDLSKFDNYVLVDVRIGQIIVQAYVNTNYHAEFIQPVVDAPLQQPPKLDDPPGTSYHHRR